MKSETLEMTEQMLLIDENAQEIQKIRNEAETRAQLLNEILRHGIVKKSEVKQIILSEKTIKDFLFNEHLKVNKFMRQQHEAGKRIAFDEYRLPDNLEHLMDSLLGWLTYPIGRGTDKFQFLIYTDQWAVNEPELESFFLKTKYKMFITGQDVDELKKLQEIRAYMLEKNATPNQIFSCSFWNERFTNDNSLSCNRLEQGKFMIKKSYFMRGR